VPDFNQIQVFLADFHTRTQYHISRKSVQWISAAVIRNGNKSVSRTDGLYIIVKILPRTLVLLPISRRQNTDDVTIKIQF